MFKDNPYKKIKELETQLEKLKAENDELKESSRAIKKLEKEYRLKMRLAEETRLSYMKLNMDLEEAKTEYIELVKKLKGEIKAVEPTYAKAVKSINKEIK
jgi:SMC interacting uncharacterized protein involved in chromosome segregation